MTKQMQLRAMLSESSKDSAPQLTPFVLLTLGILEALANGMMSATEAVQVFFNAENCLFVRKHLRAAGADKIMSHGVQLPDLFTVLPAEESHREFQRELATIRALCLKLLAEKQLVA